MQILNARRHSDLWVRYVSISIDFWQPAPELRAYVSGYHRYELGNRGSGMRYNDVFFPAWANIRFSLDADPWSVRIGRRTFDPVPERALFGPSSQAGYVAAGGGAMIGFGITPLGWWRLHGGDVSKLADRVVPLKAVFPWLDGLAQEIGASADPAALFDRHLKSRLDSCERGNPAIEILFQRLLDPVVQRVDDLGAGLGLNGRQIARLTRSCFGFTPKLLLRRARFLRAFSVVRNSERGHWKDAIPAAGYWDGSHFLRDCHQFLGMPLNEFMAMPRPINRISMQRRDAILGAPMQSLHEPELAIY